MKSIFLSVVIISALVIAGLGGTLATWSDSETSELNTITTGSVDLRVNDADDAPWGTGVPVKVSIDCMIPGKWYGPYEVKLWNAGVCEFDSLAYMHLKKLVCDNALPKPGSGYEDTYVDPLNKAYSWVYGDMKPEPELVAEYGGKVNCTEVPGIAGPVGDDCSMGSHVRMNVTDNPNAQAPFMYSNLLMKYECNELPLFYLTPCNEKYIYLWFYLVQDSEEDYGLNLIPNEGEEGYDEMHWKKFNDWPSWAMMRDKVTFDLEFDLVLEYIYSNTTGAGELPKPRPQP